MASSSNSNTKLPGSENAEGFAEIIEIRVKTMDLQTHTLRVNKEALILELKEQIAALTSVEPELQRLICRGRVMRDDYLLSHYHVEHGHTLHLVPRQQPLPYDNYPMPPRAHERGHVASSVEAPENREGQPRERDHVISALLRSLGIGIAGAVTDRVADNMQATQGGSTSQRSSEQHQQPSVVQNSLVTMSQYLNRMRQHFDSANGMRHNNARIVSVLEESITSLVELIRSTRHMFIEQAEMLLLYIARDLEDQTQIQNLARRSSLQAHAMRGGALLHNLGAYLLELARNIMTVRLGLVPNEASVNPGPAIFISETTPNSISVQPASVIQGQVEPRTRVLRIERGIIRPTQNTSQDATQMTSGMSSRGQGTHGDPLDSLLNSVPSENGRGYNISIARIFFHFPSEEEQQDLEPEEAQQQQSIRDPGGPSGTAQNPISLTDEEPEQENEEHEIDEMKAQLTPSEHGGLTESPGLNLIEETLSLPSVLRRFDLTASGDVGRERNSSDRRDSENSSSMDGDNSGTPRAETSSGPSSPASKRHRME